MHKRILTPIKATGPALRQQGEFLSEKNSNEVPDDSTFDSFVSEKTFMAVVTVILKID